MPVTKQMGQNVLQVRVPMHTVGAEYWVLLRSDAHHDNAHSDNAMELAHLKEAEDKGAGILDCGDLFCAMQGKWDPRSDTSNLRPEHANSSTYLDAITRTAADFYEPFVDNFLALGVGNHETSIARKHGVDLTQRLSATLADRTGKSIPVLGYNGWLWFIFEMMKGRSSGALVRKVLWYTHGYGGGGPVTEDMIQSNRQRTYVENADIMCSGHVHRSWCQEFVRLHLNRLGKVERRHGWYVKLPTYKDAYGTGAQGYEAEKGMGPRPLGAWWLRFRRTSNKQIDAAVMKAG